MDFDMTQLALIIAIAIILFAVDIFPPDKVSILLLTSLILTRLVTPEQAISGFGNPATITVACMLALSYGVERSGGLNFFAHKIIDLAEGKEFRVLALIVLAVGILSAFINNTAAVALFLPMTMALARQENLNLSKLLMPMSFAAMSAGTCTLIGTSTNLLVYSLAFSSIDWKIGMFEFTHLGLIVFGVTVIYLLFVSPRLIPSRRSPASLSEDYALRHFVTELLLDRDSLLVGKTLFESRLREVYNVEVIEIIRGRSRLLPSTEGTCLEPQDILLVQGHPDALMEICKAQRMTLKALRRSDRGLEDENIILLEAFLSPASRLIDSTLEEVDFRHTFKATALAIRSHRGRTIREKIGKVRLEFGDSLLILITRDQLEVLRESTEFLVFEEVGFRLVRKGKFYISVGIFVSVVLVAAIGSLTILEAAIVGFGLMVVTGCVRLHELYAYLSWQVIIMLGCLIPLGVAMESTGLASLAATELVSILSHWGPLAVLSGLYLLTTVLTSIMSNNATAVLMVPISISIASQLQVDPKPFVIAVMFAASASFLTPIGYQTNVFIFGPGGYKFQDFLKVGGPLNALCWILATLFIPIFWPF